MKREITELRELDRRKKKVCRKSERLVSKLNAAAEKFERLAENIDCTQGSISDYYFTDSIEEIENSEKAVAKRIVSECREVKDDVKKGLRELNKLITRAETLLSKVS